MGMLKFTILCHLLAFALPCLGYGSDQVPFIAWSSTNSLQSTPSIDAGHIVTKQSLQQDYLDVLPMDQPHNLFLIVMDKLSIDDITRYSNAHSTNPDGGTLTHLKSAMQSSASQLVLPAAETFDLENDLRSRVSGQVVELTSPSLKDLKVDSNKSNLIILRLSSASEPSRQAAMSSLDQALLQILGQIPGRFSPYTVVLTAQKPSTDIKEKPASINIGRHLLADKADEDKYIFIEFKQSGCQVFFYAKQLLLEVVNVTQGGFGTENVTLPADGWSKEGSECINNQTVKFVMSHPDIVESNIDTFKLEMTFNQTNTQYKYWLLEEATITMNGEHNFIMDPSSLSPAAWSSPVGISYHCSNFTLREKQQNNTEDQSTNIIKLMFIEYQVQPFGIKNDQFGRFNDCVGYFTPGIWMGLIVTIVLLLILGAGMAMLADLKVMDKFDDPKGKTITMNVNE